MASLARRRQPSASKKTLGNAFLSPRRPRNKKKTTAPAHRPGRSARLDQIQQELDEILQQHRASGLNATDSSHVADDDNLNEIVMDDFSEAWNDETPVIDEPMEDTQGDNNDSEEDGDDTKAAARARRIAEKERLYTSWKSLIPKLVDSYLMYTNTTMSRPLPPAPDMISNSACGCLSGKNHELICLYSDCESQIQYYCGLLLMQMADVKVVRVQECACRSLPDLLILHGLFPSAPAQPRFAVSIELLKLYHALFERSCDAVNALAAALHTFYTRRGLHLLNNKVSERYIYTCQYLD
jgi:hypothetical protein